MDSFRSEGKEGDLYDLRWSIRSIRVWDMVNYYYSNVSKNNHVENPLTRLKAVIRADSQSAL